MAEEVERLDLAAGARLPGPAGKSQLRCGKKEFRCRAETRQPVGW